MHCTYFDSSVLLSMLFTDKNVDRALSLWEKGGVRVTSRLTKMECSTVVHRYIQTLPEKLRPKQSKLSFDRLDRVFRHLVIYEIDREISQLISQESIFEKCRTLDSIHLATARIFARNSVEFRIATFDDRMMIVANELGMVTN